MHTQLRLMDAETILPSNWVNGQLQGQCQSPYVHKSCITGNAKAGHSPEVFYELHAIHVDPHHRRQLKSRLPSSRLDGVIYVMEAVKCTYERLGRIYSMRTIHV